MTESGETVAPFPLHAASPGPGAIIVIDASGLIAGLDAGAERLFGAGARELMGRRLAEFIHREPLPEARTVPGVTLHPLSGPPTAVEVQSTPIALGPASYVLLTLHDSGPVASLGADLRARFLDEAGQAVIATDALGAVIYWNRAAEALYGWTAEEALGRDIVALTPAEPERQTTEAIMEILRAGERWAGEILVQHRDGHTFRATVVDTPILDRAGNLVAVVGTSHDVTHHRLMEQQLGHAQRMESLGRLAGGIAHEFNNLMTVVLGYADIDAALPECPPQIREDLAEIRAAAIAAARLSNDLLAFARESADAPARTDFNRVVARLDGLLGRLPGDNARLVKSLCPAPAVVRADPVQLDQVLVHLVMNAADAIGDAPGTITITTSNLSLAEDGLVFGHLLPAGAYGCLVVHDTGPGIAPENLARVFEPFFTTKPQGEGTGMGLSVCYGIVTKAGGHLLVSSGPAQGTTFAVLLPAASPSDAFA